MKTKTFDKRFVNKLIKVALPMSFQAFMTASVAASDAFMLGSIEQNSMSAVSLATQIQFIQNLIISSVITASSILGAQYWGKKDKKAMDDIFALSLRLSGVISILFFIGCYFFPQKLMFLYTNDINLINIGAEYLRIASFSYLIIGIIQSYNIMTRVSDHITSTVIISSSAVLINIILNYIFINAMSLGVVGAANATNLARIIELFAYIFISYRKDYLRPKFVNLFLFNKILTIDFIKCMMPLLMANLFWGIGFSSYSSFMGHLGTDAAAANSITSVIRDLVCCTTDGIANGGGILVGNELGSGNLELGKDYGTQMMKMSFIIGISSGALLICLSPILVNTVKLTLIAQKYFIEMMFVMGVYMIGRSVNTITINGVFSAGGDTVFDVYSLFVSMWCIALPLAALGTYVYHWPVIIIYACTCLDEVGKIPWVIHHFYKYKWVKDLTR